MSGSLHPLFFEALQPDRIAYLYVDPEKPVSVSYGQLATRIRQGAQQLRQMGLQTGDGLVVVSENHPDLLSLYWAAQICGLYWTAISAQFQHDEIDYILNDCDASLLVASQGQRAKITTPAQPHELLLDDWLETISSQPDELIEDPAEGAEMLYSSGTTGRPKGVRAATPGAALGSVSELFRRRLDLHQIDADAIYLSTAPLYHSAPLRYNAMIHRSGGTSIIMPRFDAEQALALIEAHSITHSQWVPTMFVRMLKLPDSIRFRYDRSSLRFAIHAAAPCPISVKEQMLEWWGDVLYEYYSGTEGNGQTAIGPSEWRAHKGSVGQSILGTLKILDSNGVELPSGETGLVYFADGPQFEYYKDPDKTAAAFNDRGWSTLGDIGHLDADGYLYLTDRASQMIITGGVNVYPREVEDVLIDHPAVADAAVFGVPDAEFGEAVRAAVELIAGGEVSEAELINFARDRLAHLKCPRHIDFPAALPRHQTGKLYKQALRKPFWPD